SALFASRPVWEARPSRQTGCTSRPGRWSLPMPCRRLNRGLTFVAAAAALLLPTAALTQARPASPAAGAANLAADAPLPEGLKLDSYRLWPGRAPGAPSDA